MEKTRVLSLKKTNRIIVKVDLRIPTITPPPTTIQLTSSHTLHDLILRLNQDFEIELVDNEDRLKPHFLVLINSRQIEVLDGVSSLLHDGDKITILSAVHGGNQISFNIWN